MMHSTNELKKLSEESLTRQPEEVFEIICKLGKGSYGSVYKALHRESGEVLAIKQVPVDTDLKEIIKEISIMQQCDSPYVVQYYGSYFKNTDLWIVMEYCGAGSVSDIMKLRKKTLTEDEIATILFDTLKGLEYLHLRKKIHRDIKAGNILLNSEGYAKLADFGVAGQLTDTMTKRNTLIGTPFWMAPEVIQEIGYDCVADIWSLGITALEMAEAKPPYGDIHPIRAIFMIPTKPPPSFRKPDQWSTEFIDFVSRCLVKNPEDRAIASDLLKHVFIDNAKPSTILARMIAEAHEIRENIININEESDEEVTVTNHSQTVIQCKIKSTLIPDKGGTLVPMSQNGTLIELQSELGTMIINSDIDENTVKTHDTCSWQFSRNYRLLPSNHADKKEAEVKGNSVASSATLGVAEIYVDEQQCFESNFNLQMNLTQHLQPVCQVNFKLPFTAGDVEVFKNLSFEELQQRMIILDSAMESEIDELGRRYQTKRQYILDAMGTRQKRQQNF